MAMLLVLMLVVLVSAAGVFAAQSAALDVRSSGYFRQAAQTHYVAEAGAVASLDELRRNCSQYKRMMDARAATIGTVVGSEAEVRRQYAFYLEDFERLTAAPLFVSTTMGSTGSLGPGALQPGFITTATLLYEVPSTLVGQDVNSRWPTYVFELAANGSTRLPVTDTRGNAVGNEETRVIAQVPCF